MRARRSRRPDPAHEAAGRPRLATDQARGAPVAAGEGAHASRAPVGADRLHARRPGRPTGQRGPATFPPGMRRPPPAMRRAARRGVPPLHRPRPGEAVELLIRRRSGPASAPTRGPGQRPFRPQSPAHGLQYPRAGRTRPSSRSTPAGPQARRRADALLRLAPRALRRPTMRGPTRLDAGAPLHGSAPPPGSVFVQGLDQPALGRRRAAGARRGRARRSPARLMVGHRRAGGARRRAGGRAPPRDPVRGGHRQPCGAPARADPGPRRRRSLGGGAGLRRGWTSRCPWASAWRSGCARSSRPSLRARGGGGARGAGRGSASARRRVAGRRGRPRRRGAARPAHGAFADRARRRRGGRNELPAGRRPGPRVGAHWPAS